MCKSFKEADPTCSNLQRVACARVAPLRVLSESSIVENNQDYILDEGRPNVEAKMLLKTGWLLQFALLALHGRASF